MEEENMMSNIKMCSEKNEWVIYYELASKDIDRQWETLILPKLKKEDIDFRIVMDLACGAGRNSMKLLPLCQKIYCVDLNKYALDLCKENLIKNQQNYNKITFIQNNGYDISSIPDDSLTFIYQFDSGVHMSKEVIRMYIKEFSRILSKNGKGFFHHSNYGNKEGVDKSNFKLNPHWRTDMTKELFKQYCEEFGLVCFRQDLIDWEYKDLDCFSFFQKK